VHKHLDKQEFAPKLIITLPPQQDCTNVVDLSHTKTPNKEGIGIYLMQLIKEPTTYLLTKHGGIYLKQQTRFTSVSTQNACQLQSHQKPNLFIH
jgi:hypothetical protein